MSVRSFARALLLAVAALSFAACSSIHVESQGWSAFDLADAPSFAWGDVRSDIDDAPVAAVHAAVEQRLVARGLRRTSVAQAAHLIDLVFEVETDIRENDPWFNTFAVERYETGTLTLELRDAVSRELLWSGSGRSELRVTAVPNSPFSGELSDTGAARDWNLGRKIPEILERLPARFAGDAEG